MSCFRLWLGLYNLLRSLRVPWMSLRHCKVHWVVHWAKRWVFMGLGLYKDIVLLACPLSVNIIIKSRALYCDQGMDLIHWAKYGYHKQFRWFRSINNRSLNQPGSSKPTNIGWSGLVNLLVWSGPELVPIRTRATLLSCSHSQSCQIKQYWTIRVVHGH